MAITEEKRGTGGDQRHEAPVMHAPGRPFGGFGPGPGGPGRMRGMVVKPRNFTGTLRRLWGYMESERKWLLLIFISVMFQSVLALFSPYLIGMGVDAMGLGMGDVDFRLLGLAIMAMLIAYLTEGSLSLFQGWVMAGLSQRVVTRLRRMLFGKLQKLPLSFFDTRPHGDVMSRLSNDIDNVSNTISQSAVQIMSGSIALIGSFIMMLVLSPILTLASLITVPLVYLLARTVTRKTRVLFREQQAQLGRLNGHIEETITGMEVVWAFNHEAHSLAEFEEENRKLYEVSRKAQIWSGFLMPLLSVINNIGFAAVALVGGALAVRGHITVGVIASFISYSRQFVRPLNDLANMFNILQSGVAGAERAFEIMDEAEEEPDPPGAAVLQNPKGHVVFEQVHFGYRPDVPILRDVSFEAEPGSVTALVGPTGAGKTTIVNLLTRFYDVSEGRVTIDGRDILDYTRDSLRRSFGIVLQDTYLFSGTIRDNLKYGNPDATDEEMVEAARLVGADAFIRRLPQGYDTVLAENGGNLSHGQRQLLSIARVMLAKPAILILDEATSSIDTRTEMQVQKALATVMQGRTSFIIAHRLNTIRRADTIMVIDHGQIVEQGNHEQLMRAKGPYARMVESQLNLKQPLTD